MRSPIAVVDVDRVDTWTRYKSGLCDTCAANCCTMPVEVRLADLVRLGWVDAFEAEHTPIQKINKALQKAGRVERYNAKNAVFTLCRRADGDCSLLDPLTRRCTVYTLRPETCRKHPQTGPRPGYCPYGRQERIAKHRSSPPG